MRMMEIIASRTRDDTRRSVFGADIGTRNRRRSAPIIPGARPLPWRWSVLIITTLSTLVWLAVLFGVISLLDHL
jgi:hypothetical protein